MKKLLSLLLFFTLTIQSSFADHHITDKDVKDFVTLLSGKVIQSIKQNTDDVIKRKQAFEDIFKQYGDVPKIARFVSGKAWALADSATQTEYTKNYASYMAYSYAVRLSSYDDQKIIVGRITPRGKKGYLVDTKLSTNPTLPPLSIVWQLFTKADTLKVVDLRIENISMSLTQRSEFSGILQKNNQDLSKLNDLLKARMAKNIETAGKQ